MFKKVPPATRTNPTWPCRALAGKAHRFGEGEGWPAAWAANRRTLLVFEAVWGR